MDGFVSYEEDFEEDALFSRQPVEVEKKRWRREGTGDIVIEKIVKSKNILIVFLYLYMMSNPRMEYYVMIIDVF